MKSRIWNSMGTMLMILIMIISAPFFVPMLFGVSNYAVLTGSMEPVYPRNSIVYVKRLSAAQIQTGDVITFSGQEGSTEVTTHRVVAVQEDRQTFVTKGDANAENDAEEVTFSRVIGKAVYCVPHLGILAEFVGSVIGKVTEGMLFFLTILFWIAGSMVAKTEKEQNKQTE